MLGWAEYQRCYCTKNRFFEIKRSKIMVVIIPGITRLCDECGLVEPSDGLLLSIIMCDSVCIETSGTFATSSRSSQQQPPPHRRSRSSSSFRVADKFDAGSTKRRSYLVSICLRFSRSRAEKPELPTYYHALPFDYQPSFEPVIHSNRPSPVRVQRTSPGSSQGR